MADDSATRVLFSGRVQGVGFRWTTNRLAKRHPVTGYVRNLSDGRVELVVQGDSAAVDGLLNDVRSHFGDNITAEESEPMSESVDFTQFEIRR